MNLWGRCFVCMYSSSNRFHNTRNPNLRVGLQFTFLQDDVGVPLNYRHMEGFGVHTYTLINKDGRVTYVKFHWQPALGALTSQLSYFCINTGRSSCVLAVSDLTQLLVLISKTQSMTDQIMHSKRLGARSLYPCQLISVYHNLYRLA